MREDPGARDHAARGLTKNPGPQIGDTGSMRLPTSGSSTSPGAPQLCCGNVGTDQGQKLDRDSTVAWTFGIGGWAVCASRSPCSTGPRRQRGVTHSRTVGHPARDRPRSNGRTLSELVKCASSSNSDTLALQARTRFVCWQWLGDTRITGDGSFRVGCVPRRQ
jgi:hypothetical protein